MYFSYLRALNQNWIRNDSILIYIVEFEILIFFHILPLELRKEFYNIFFTLFYFRIGIESEIWYWFEILILEIQLRTSQRDIESPHLRILSWDCTRITSSTLPCPDITSVTSITIMTIGIDVSPRYPGRRAISYYITHRRVRSLARSRGAGYTKVAYHEQV